MGLFNRHTHHWEETGRSRIPPVKLDIDNITGLAAIEAVIDAYVERTAVQMKCRTCGDVQSRIIEGWVEPDKGQ